MAVVEYAVYSEKKDCKRVNTYISDGHGRSPAERTNRYFGTGGDSGTQCLGHQCPGDPMLATAYMGQIRRNYDRQHSVDFERKYGSVTHVQLFVSHAEGERITIEERMEMTGELIRRTVLRDYPSIRIAHNNTKYDHTHISVCPYAIDGSHKLCVNKKLLYDLRREMDHICVEHGYSIIERPELLADEDYRVWFLKVREEGTVTIHPPRNWDDANAKRELSYAARRRQQAEQEEGIRAFYHEICQQDTEENDQYYYTSPYLYHPYDPLNPVRIQRITEDGRERGELTLRAAALGTWAYHCQQELQKKAIPHTEDLQDQLYKMSVRAYDTQQILDALDIRSQEELILHMRECRQDIGTLQREISKQGAILRELEPMIRMINRWESDKDPDAYAYLESHGCGTDAQMAAVKRKHTRVAARRECSAKLLDDRKKEHHYLRGAERTLHPVSCSDAWEAYLDTMFTADLQQQVKRVSVCDLEDRIIDLGFMLGLSTETLDVYLDQVEDYAEQIRWRECRQLEYDEFDHRIADAIRIRSNAFDRYRKEQDVLDCLWNMREKLASLGLLGFLFGLLIDAIIDVCADFSKINLDIALWESGREIRNAELCRAINGDLIPYYAEVRRQMANDRQKASTAIYKLIDEALIVHREDRRQELRTRRPGLREGDDRSM